MSYILETRSGNEIEFLDMTTRCNAVGIRIYVDVVFNHMASPADNAIGTAGTTANPTERDFPAVSYTINDFHQSCSIENYQNATQVRDCELGTLPDLDQKKENVRTKIVEFLNHLVNLGVAGFRVDASKHMWPRDLTIIYSRLNRLNTSFGFPKNSPPFIYQEVIDLGGEAVKKQEYTQFGAVTEFLSSSLIGSAFQRKTTLKSLQFWGPQLGFLPTKQSLVFVDNHDNQRGHGAGGDTILTYKNDNSYKMAVSFLLGHPFGLVRIMSSFNFTNSDQGPPQDTNGNIISPDETCSNGWVCEHRWKEIINMIIFRNTVKETFITNWRNYLPNQISFQRGAKGFMAFNNDESNDLRISMRLTLPSGIYCDVISGYVQWYKCTGKSIVVGIDGKIDVTLTSGEFLAIHVGAKV